jgi:hypothetical protein
MPLRLRGSATGTLEDWLVSILSLEKIEYDPPLGCVWST